MISEVVLRSHADKRLKQGYPWLYSNEIDNHKTPLSSFVPGQLVCIRGHHLEAIATGYINPHSLIAVRVISLDPQQFLDEALIETRLADALRLRNCFFKKPYYRLVYSEGDFLPGLIVDRFGDHLVIQLNTAGMEAQKEIIKNVLIKLLNPLSILVRNTSSIRQLENMSAYTAPLLNQPPAFVEIEENGVLFQVPLLEGQKTGWFYDHRSSRALLADYVLDKSVLDVFSYIGGFGIQAAVQGACEVTCIDSSQAALTQVKVNAKLNGVEKKINVLCEDVFDALTELKNKNNLFDVVMVDPPAFIKKRKDMDKGIQAYLRLNSLAMKLVKPRGILFSASCSMHLSKEKMLMMLQKAALRSKKTLQILMQNHPGQDHPLHPLLSEMDYLKGFVMEVH